MNTDAARRAAPRPSIFAALKLYPSYRLLWIGTVVTQLGQWMQQIALGWYMLGLTDSAFWVGLIGFCAGLPYLLIALPAGSLIDRSDERKVLMLSQWAAMSVAAGLAVLILLDVAQPWHLLVVAALNGSTNTINQMVRQTFVPALVPREHLANAVSLSSAGGNATRIIGPSIAGIIIGTLGVAACFIVQAVSLALALGTTLRIQRVYEERGRSAAGGVLDGVKEALHRPAIGGLILITSIPAVLVFPYVQLMSVFARDVWDIGAGGLGLLMMASGLGALAGALTAASMDRVQRKGLVVMITITTYCLAVGGFAASPHPALGMLGLAIAGFSMAIWGSLSNALLLLLADPRLRGRIMGVYMVTSGFTPFGALALGALSDAYGAPPALAGSCLLSAALTGLIAVKMRELRAPI
jgi:MFS family permease